LDDSSCLGVFDASVIASPFLDEVKGLLDSSVLISLLGISVRLLGSKGACSLLNASRLGMEVRIVIKFSLSSKSFGYGISVEGALGSAEAKVFMGSFSESELDSGKCIGTQSIYQVILIDVGCS